ncbi:MAG: Sulfur carrier protein CysO [Syntrophorhabdus sp. PtaU1.Bin002]|nr:MAG: Sulfur carrier protein CysO [Syntrophorhabdus sp. PtaB.Bin006]OPY69693.1 MAG: Sulfur carrier protein CysO [Syntrophorhabdus sp. PtaU1.Bin002]
MSVKVTIHPFLNNGVETQVDMEAHTTGNVINEILKRIPGTEKKLFQKPGQLKGYVEVYVNGKSTYPNELSTPLNDGDAVSVLIFLAGG